ncbi:MAG: site-2 protease family protein [Chloroflexota bacterium]|nr:site-2 protease family protein [Chloroflexota bacterium]
MLLFEALQDPQRAAALIVALVLGITVHEFSHAAAATWLGDSLPRQQGRLTLAPLAHLDVMGSLMFIVGGFGWGKPVQYNPYALRAGPRSGPAIVSAAGPISNVIFAVLIAIPTRLLIIWSSGGSRFFASQPAPAVLTVLDFLQFIIFYNLILSFFNLIPIFPLDGFTILQGLLPPQMAEQFEQTRQWGIFLLLALLFVGSSVLGNVIYGPAWSFTQLLTGV